jgi:beta-phosphoglucomutase-like phosphatase (HAD superfamily)
MTTAKQIAALLFDVDGVVVESELLHMATFNELLEDFGIVITETDWRERFVGKGSDYIMQALFTQHRITEDIRPWVDRRRQLYRDHVASGDLHSVAGFPSFFASVEASQLPIAFVSTGHPLNIAAALSSLDLVGKYPIIDSTMVTRLKPDPEAYLCAAETLKVSPELCLVFEDSPIGVAAAKAANMTCVALTTTNSPSYLKGADLILPNFQGQTLQTILQSLGLA